MAHYNVEAAAQDEGGYELEFYVKTDVKIEDWVRAGFSLDQEISNHEFAHFLLSLEDN